MKGLVRGLVGLALLGALPAFAQVTEPTRVRDREVKVDLHGGAGGYTGNLGDITGVGPMWGVSVGTDATPYIGGEISYDGGRVPMDDPRLDGGGLMNNAVQGALKLKAPLGDVEPYVMGGIGVGLLSPNLGAQIYYNSDWVTEIPVGAGVDVDLGAINAGVRGTFTNLYGEELADVGVPSVVDNTTGSRFSGTITLGGEF